MQKTISILLCDDHELIISGLQQVLNHISFVEEIKTTKNGYDAIQRLKEKQYDLIISDVSIPDMDGIELSAVIKEEFPDTKIIILTQFSDIQILKPLLKNDVNGILLKGGKNSEIIETIEKVMAGEKSYSSTIMHVIAECYLGISNLPELLVKLSKRKKQVLELIAEELTNKDISEKLFISVPTVETYRRNLFRKFDVKNSAGLIRKAMRLGFVS